MRHFRRVEVSTTSNPPASTIKVKPLSAILASFSSGGPEVALTSPKGIMPGRYGKNELAP